MNNFPAMTEGQRQELISDCQAEIVQIEKALTTWGEAWSSCWQSKLTRQKIVLAALTAEPEAYLTVRLPGVKGIGNARKIIDGKQYDPTKDSYWSPGGKDKHIVVPLYPAPPAPVLRVPDGWIKCSERMPLELSDEHISEVEVIVTDGTTVGTCEYRRGYIPRPWAEWSNYGDIDADKISHWQPLPKPPETSNEQ